MSTQANTLPSAERIFNSQNQGYPTTAEASPDHRSRVILMSCRLSRVTVKACPSLQGLPDYVC